MSDTDATTTARQRLAKTTFRIGGDLEVHRLGFGAMQITGDGVWGEPDDRDAAKTVLRRAVDLGVNLIDTADSYGPDVSERLIGEAFPEYPEGLVIATKAGLVRPAPSRWEPDGRPEHIRQAFAGSLERLHVDRIDLYQFHRPDPKVPLEESMRTFADLRDEGKVRHVGICNVTVDELEEARAIVPIATVQNEYNLAYREHEDVLDRCEELGIGFIPWFPLGSGELVSPEGPLAKIAQRLDATPAQILLAWLLKRSPVTLPIPGTSDVEHLEENVAAAALDLTDADFEEISHVGEGMDYDL